MHFYPGFQEDINQGLVAFYIQLFDRLPLRFGGIDFTILAAILILNLAVQGLQHIVLWIVMAIY